MYPQTCNQESNVHSNELSAVLNGNTSVIDKVECSKVSKDKFDKKLGQDWTKGILEQ